MPEYGVKKYTMAAAKRQGRGSRGFLYMAAEPGAI